MRHALTWFAVGLLWVAALWRIPPLPPPWGPPDGLLVAMLAWTLTRRPEPSWQRATAVGALIGALKDAATGGPFGLWTMVFAATSWLATRNAHMIARDEPVVQFLWITAFAMGTILAYALVMGLRGEGPLAFGIIASFLIPSSLVTGAAGLILFPLLSRGFGPRKPNHGPLASGFGPR